MIGGALREAWRRLTRQSGEPVELMIRPVASGD
jgi:hypothetical protein